MSSSSIEIKEYQVFEEHLFEEIELDSIVKLQFNEETLKKNFEVLIKILKDLKIGVSKANHKCHVNEKEIKELNKNNEHLQKEVDSLKDQNTNLIDEINKLKEKQDQQQSEINHLKDENDGNKKKIEEQQDQIDNLNRDNDQNKQDISDLKDELSKLKSQLESIQLQLSLLNGKGGDGVDADALQKLLKEIKKIKDEYVTKVEYKQQITIINDDISWIKDELEKLKRQFEDLQNSLSKLSGLKDLHNLKDQIYELMNRLKIIENSIKDKVDFDIFEQQINYLKSLIQSLGSGKEVPQQILQPGLSAKEAALLKELDRRVGDLEDAIKELRKELKDHKNNYGDYTQKTDNRLDKIEDLLSSFQKQLGQIKQLKDLIDKLTYAHQETNNLALSNEEKIKELKRRLDYLQELMKDNNRGEVITKGGDGISEEYLQQKMKVLRDELINLINYHSHLLNDKVSYPDLYKSEALIMTKLDQVAEAILKKCADKQETKKALIYLEKKINQLFFLLQELKGNGNGNKEKSKEEDALLSRRQLWSCVSCDKALDDYNGRLGDHKYWGMFPPKETTPERLGKFGKQFRYMQEKQLIREKQFDKQKISQSQQQFKTRFQNLPGQLNDNDVELPNINPKSTH